MGDTMKRIALGAGAIAMAGALAAGAYAAGQSVSLAQDPGVGGPAGQGGFGGPGGRGGPFGRGGRGPGGPGMPGRPGGPMGGPGDVLGPMMLGRLDLSDAQREQVRTIVESHRDELRELGERGMHARQALEAAVMANVFDEAAIRAAAAEVGVVEADMAVARARISAEVHQVLTAEQQAKLEQLRAQMRERMESRRQRRQASL